jgi:hypothetical protein
MKIYQIVQKTIASGEEVRYGEFANRPWAEKMAQEADRALPGCVHWVEEHPAPSVWASKWELCENDVNESYHSSGPRQIPKSTFFSRQKLSGDSQRR